MDDMSGFELKGYEIRKRIGSGGMGAVYQALQIAMKRDVAIKILPAELADNPDYLVRFNREAETLTRLEHPHIVPVYDYGAIGKTSYIVMRLLTGGSLNQHLLQNGIPPLTETRQIIQQVASALTYGHQRGIIHRDIKASNVMLDEQGNAYLTDFGIAKLLHSTTGFTATGMMLGTPAYMAPEQWKGIESNAQTDIYALGVLLYAMVTGQLPFEAPTPFALMGKHLHETPVPATERHPGLPLKINTVLDKALAKDPASRFQSAVELSNSLNSAIGSSGSTMSLPSEEMAPTVRDEKLPSGDEIPTTLVRQGAMPYVRSKWWWLAIPAIAVLAIAVIAVIILTGDGDDDTTNENALSSTQTSEAGTGTAIALFQINSTIEVTSTVVTDTPTSEPFTPTINASDTSLPPTSTNTIVPSATQVENSPIPPDTATFTFTPSDTPTLTLTPTSTQTPTLTSTSTATSTNTSIPSPTATPSNTVQPTATLGKGLPGGAPVTANSEWTPIQRTINGVPMVLVPAGSFTMGSGEAQLEVEYAYCLQVLGASTCSSLLDDEFQQQPTTFSQPYWIDKTEVTNAIFSGGTGDNFPKTNLDWSQAQQSCQARSGRLPTEPEWEYAARGPDNLIFAWGNDWDNQSRANYCDSNCGSNWRDNGYNDGYQAVAPVGTYPLGASWVGALDMGGNVWEWTSTIYRAYPYSATDGREDSTNSTTQRTLRGGGYTWILAEVTTTARSPHIASGPYTPYYGFRCVRPYQNGDLTNFSQ